MRIYVLLSLIMLSMMLSASFLLLPTRGVAPAWSIQTVDKNADRVGNIGIALDSHNNPHIAYTDFEGGAFENPTDVMYASWNGSGWNIQTVVRGGSTVDFALDSHDTPHILFEGDGYPYAFSGLQYASWTGSNWTIQTVDEQGEGPGSLALDSVGNPHIAYIINENPTVLNYAVWTGSTWSIQTVDSAMPQGFLNSVYLALDSSNNPHIMYEKPSDIAYATWNANSGWNIQSVLEGNVFVERMVLDSNGYPHFIYTEDNPSPNNGSLIRTLAYDNWNGSAWNSQTVASNIGIPGGGDFTLDSHGYPCIDYFSGASEGPVGVLTYARWTGTTWDIQTVDSDSATYSGPIALDSNGNPYIAYPGPQPATLIDYLMFATAIEPAPTPIATPTASPTPVPTGGVSSWIILPLFAIAIIAVLMYVWKKKTQKIAKLDMPAK